ncbi:DUF3800 domain-containing protein [Roseospirillum parvum]|uniref:DUF3800 domain-containing protein n=1 Tax=Roseospirillum parvum TaxID=83401 RepID=A0A1G8FP57_9PROT|nr:DUF3800 domain-containing protein [Roseospirillum parvum]SDH83869.1 Protein of unknown function [Roseospirillum parvum]
MYLLYLDDSGSVRNADDRHIVLAGVAVFERTPYWLSNELDTLAHRIWPEAPEELEFRGTDMRAGKKKWRRIPRTERDQAYREALQRLAIRRDALLFGAAVHRQAVAPEDPMEHAFEQVCNRFDRFLGRLHKNGNTQRGLIVLDESSYETSLQGLAKHFRTDGHRWGRTRNLAEVPLFVDSTATRMIQYADLVAHAVRRYYENGDSQLFDLIAHRFDAVGGQVHGLTHITPSDIDCPCLVCRQRTR